MNQIITPSTAFAFVIAAALVCVGLVLGLVTAGVCHSWSQAWRYGAAMMTGAITGACLMILTSAARAMHEDLRHDVSSERDPK